MASLAAAKEMAEFYLETAAPGMVIHDQIEHVDGWEFMVNWPGQPGSVDGFYAFVNSLGMVKTQPQPYSNPRPGQSVMVASMTEFYSASQPRDGHGRWAKGHGGSPVDDVSPSDLATALSEIDAYGIETPLFKEAAIGAERLVEDRIASMEDDPSTGEAVAQNLRASLGDAQLKVGVPPHRVDSILGDGQFLPGHIVGTDMGNGGPDYYKIRQWAEDTLIGVPRGTDDAERPVYGYFEGPSTRGLFSENTKETFPLNFVVKPEVRDRATVTFGDSLNNLATPIKVKDLATTSTEDIIRSTGQGMAEYAEAQIHGGLTLDDISHVEINIGTIEDSLTNLLSQRDTLPEGPLRRMADFHIESLQDRLGELEDAEIAVEEAGIDVRRI